MLPFHERLAARRVSKGFRALLDAPNTGIWDTVDFTALPQPLQDATIVSAGAFLQARGGARSLDLQSLSRAPWASIPPLLLGLGAKLVRLYLQNTTILQGGAAAELVLDSDDVGILRGATGAHLHLDLCDSASQRVLGLLEDETLTVHGLELGGREAPAGNLYSLLAAALPRSLTYLVLNDCLEVAADLTNLVHLERVDLLDFPAASALPTLPASVRRLGIQQGGAGQVGQHAISAILASRVAEITVTSPGLGPNHSQEPPWQLISLGLGVSMLTLRPSSRMDRPTGAS
jgi:F-box domain